MIVFEKIEWLGVERGRDGRENRMEETESTVGLQKRNGGNGRGMEGEMEIRSGAGNVRGIGEGKICGGTGK